MSSNNRKSEKADEILNENILSIKIRIEKNDLKQEYMV